MGFSRSSQALKEQAEIESSDGSDLIVTRCSVAQCQLGLLDVAQSLGRPGKS
jgi:hypothetical protein